MSKEGKELAKALFERFLTPSRVAKETGLSESTIEKWRLGIRSPNTRNYRKCSILLQGDSLQEREERIRFYKQQIEQKGLISWELSP